MIRYKRRWFRTPRWEAHYKDGHTWAMGWGDTQREAFDMLFTKLLATHAEVSMPRDETPDPGSAGWLPCTCEDLAVEAVSPTCRRHAGGAS